MPQAFDMPESLAFYRDLPGFEMIAAAPPAPKGTNNNFGWVWLRHSQAQLMLNTAYDPDDQRAATREPARVAAHDDTIRCIGTSGIESSNPGPCPVPVAPATCLESPAASCTGVS